MQLASVRLEPRDWLSPALDFFLIGGLSVIFCAVLWLTVHPSVSLLWSSRIAAWLAFGINFPHFLASYWLLYRDRRQELLKASNFKIAGVIVPVLLAEVLTLGGVFKWIDALGYLVNAMYFLVGWHYVKQVYGIVLLSCRRNLFHLSPRDAWVLKASLVSVWAVSFLAANREARKLDFYGIPFETFALQGGLFWLSCAATILLVLALMVRTLLQSRMQKRAPGWTAVAGFLSVFVWYWPFSAHPHFFYFIPLFHSLQYLLFVWALKRAQADSRAPGKALTGFQLAVTGLGALAFSLIPETLDRWVSYDRQALGNQFFVFSFMIFLNIHHYFIDSVIWRKDSPGIAALLKSGRE